MEIKSQTSKLAMALCALAVFSFTAQAAIQPDDVPGPTPSVVPIKNDKIQPFPAIQPPVTVGTFNGTVME